MSSLIAGELPNEFTLWIISRQPGMPQTLTRLLEALRDLGRSGMNHLGDIEGRRFAFLRKKAIFTFQHRCQLFEVGGT